MAARTATVVLGRYRRRNHASGRSASGNTTTRCQKRYGTPELAAEVSPKSGILLFHEYGDPVRIAMNVHRQAKPRKEAKPIEPSEAIEVAKAMQCPHVGGLR